MKKKNKRIRNRESAVLNSKTNFSTVESYKAARTNLMFKLAGSGEKKTVVITSSEATEGKTTVCINIAITFAQSGSRVLIIDADMRRPMVHRYLNVQSSPGLSDKIGGFEEDKACVYRTEIENLFVMPAGSTPPNPAELLMSARMTSFLKVFTDNFDYVFIDAPPVGLVTDAAVIGEKCGGVLFVCRQNYSHRDRIRSALKALENAGANVFGFIFNDVSEPSKKKYSGGRGGYYGYYGYYDDNRRR